MGGLVLKIRNVAAVIGLMLVGLVSGRELIHAAYDNVAIIQLQHLMLQGARSDRNGSARLEAIEILVAKSSKLGAVTPTVFWLLGEIYQQFGDLDRARAAWSKRPANAAQMLTRRGVAALEGGLMDTARRYFVLATEIDPAYGEPHRLLGIVDYALGHWRSALFEFKIAAQLDPENASAHAYASWVEYLIERNSQQAEMQLLRSLELERDNPYALQFLGELYRREERYDDAEAYLKRAVTLSPKHVDLRLLLAQVYLDQNRYGDALSELKQALYLEDSHRVHAAMGNVYLQASQYDDAAREFQIAIMARPDIVSYYLRLGDALLASGLSVEAREAYCKALRLEPTNADARQAVESLGLDCWCAPL